MTEPNEFDELTGDDRILLDQIEAMLDKRERAGSESDSILGLCAHLASTVPQARREYQQRVWASLAAKKEETLKDQPASFRGIQSGHFPAWSRRSPHRPNLLASALVGPLAKPVLHRRRNAFITIAAIIAVLVLAVTFISPVRAFASQFVKQIILGKYSEVSQVELPTTGATRAATLPAAMWSIDAGVSGAGGSVPQGIDPTVRTFNNIEEAQAQVSYPILHPKYLPDGYRLREIKVTPKGIPEYVFLFYSGPGKDIFVASFPVGEGPITPSGTVAPDGSVIVSQLVSAVGIQTNGSLEQAVVDGNIAAWINGDLLAWEGSGFVYQVGGVGLTENEAIKIAESIK